MTCVPLSTQLCPVLPEVSALYLNFGSNINYTCIFNLSTLLTMEQTVFFDLCIQFVCRFRSNSCPPPYASSHPEPR